MNPVPVHPQLNGLLELSALLATAAETGARRAQGMLRRRHRGGVCRRPGAETPMWNLMARELRGTLAPRGAKIRLARYLGIPKQRLQDFLRARSRLPDAELTLRMLHWLVEQRTTSHDRTI